MIIADNDLYKPTFRVEKKPFRNAPVHKRDPIGGNVRTDFPMVQCTYYRKEQYIFSTFRCYLPSNAYDLYTPRGNAINFFFEKKKKTRARIK